ncbi:hypothetical protein KUTeg_020685 [Tegillarca granosa]|uniref:Uncharacterized protein n=1 Tax=Tegillarca granosa TaxID=220873 RepID=A0ABQ9E8N5_TEGGR|nr:hypothetical protein KUTeg_020685 [Tegillarca granosa]
MSTDICLCKIPFTVDKFFHVILFSAGRTGNKKNSLLEHFSFNSHCVGLNIICAINMCFTK